MGPESKDALLAAQLVVIELHSQLAGCCYYYYH